MEDDHISISPQESTILALLAEFPDLPEEKAKDYLVLLTAQVRGVGLALRGAKDVSLAQREIADAYLFWVKENREYRASRVNGPIQRD